MSVHTRPAIAAVVNPCLLCAPIVGTLPMDAVIAVGFGYAAVTRDGVEVLSEVPDFDQCPTVADAEALASAAPDADWLILLHAPLHSSTYQRHGPGRWCLVERGSGFA